MDKTLATVLNPGMNNLLNVSATRTSLNLTLGAFD